MSRERVGLPTDQSRQPETPNLQIITAQQGSKLTFLLGSTGAPNFKKLGAPKIFRSTHWILRSNTTAKWAEGLATSFLMIKIFINWTWSLSCSALFFIHAIYRGKMRRKCNLNFSQNSQFPSEIHSYKPPLPIQYLGFPFHISHVNVELAQAATVFSFLCVRLQR